MSQPLQPKSITDLVVGRPYRYVGSGTWLIDPATLVIDTIKNFWKDTMEGFHTGKTSVMLAPGSLIVVVNKLHNDPPWTITGACYIITESGMCGVVSCFPHHLHFMPVVENNLE